MAALPEPTAPHLDPTTWSRLVDSLDAATIFVVIGGWVGAQARVDVSIEDVWQETLWMAWRDRLQHQWAGLGRYRAWLLGIAHNRVRELVRNRGRQKRGGATPHARFSDLGGNDTVDGYLPPRSTTPSRVASNLERARLLERALDAVEPPLRDVVRLRVFEELPATEVAAALDIPLSTCKHRFVRGLQAYRDELRRLGGGQDAEPSEPR
ncbi:MAG: RNA polymerase sigma factor [Planctomycetes bacterium]|nr:RNA polymerase sigma factor [Planctomycetota bacterium]